MRSQLTFFQNGQPLDENDLIQIEQMWEQTAPWQVKAIKAFDDALALHKRLKTFESSIKEVCDAWNQLRTHSSWHHRYALSADYENISNEINITKLCVERGGHRIYSDNNI